MPGPREKTSLRLVLEQREAAWLARGGSPVLGRRTCFGFGSMRGPGDAARARSLPLSLGRGSWLFSPYAGVRARAAPAAHAPVTDREGVGFCPSIPETDSRRGPGPHEVLCPF